MTDIAEKREDVEWNTQSEVRTCSECGSFDIIYDPERGEYVCGTCGLVLSAKLIDSEREGRWSFSMEEKSQRDQTGSPVSVLLPDLGLSTVIDANAQTSQRMKRIIKWNTRMTGAIATC